MRTFLIPSLLFSVAASGALAQTHTQTHATTHTRAAAPTRSTACATLPTISSKVPAPPAGSPCARVLYSIVTEPPAKLVDVSPMAGEDIRQTLGLESSSFSEDYIDTKVGTGPLAEPGKFYSIQYTGYLTDGTKFDSSLDRGEPIVIHYGQHQVIPGWDTGFGGMHVGGKRRLFIPYQLAYGAQQHGPIPPKSMLIFDVELVAQNDRQPEPKPQPKPATAAPTAPAQPNAGQPATAPAPAGAKPAPPTTTPAPSSAVPTPSDTKPKPPM